MASKDRSERFVTDPIPSQDDGSPTEYEKNVARVLGEAQNPPAEPA